MHVQPSDALPKIMLARYYGANLGRFLSVDPVGGKPPSPQSWNGYAYVENNPMIRFDPFGREYKIYLQYDSSYQHQWANPRGPDFHQGLQKANQKFENAGSQVRVAGALHTDTQLDATDRVVTIKNSPPEGTNPDAVGATNPDGSMEVYADNVYSDNLDSSVNEAAEAIGNTLAHEAGHSYGLEYDDSQAETGADGEPDNVHNKNPDSVMHSTSGGKTSKEFDEVDKKQLP